VRLRRIERDQTFNDDFAVPWVFDPSKQNAYFAEESESIFRPAARSRTDAPKPCVRDADGRQETAVDLVDRDVPFFLR
jgi:hypothetical protein